MNKVAVVLEVKELMKQRESLINKVMKLNEFYPHYKLSKLKLTEQITLIDDRLKVING